MSSAYKLKFIDLFAGIGGFHYAFHQLDCECVFASEIDRSAREIYERNFYSKSPELFDNGCFNDDIRKVSANEIPDFDILCAGFPCQPFSQAGYKKGFSDGNNSERGNLFFNIVDILEAKNPKAFFLENVRGIVNHDNGRTFSIIREILEDELGYSFYFKVVKATDYGLPQHRPRAFIIGFRDEGFLKSFVFPRGIPLKFNMSDVFEGNCSREIGFTLRVGGAGSNINDKRNWDSYLVDDKVVRIQPKHALKIQGFPENFVLPNSRTEAMKQLGNSVAVDAVKECASALIDHLKIIDNRKKRASEMEKTRNKGEWSELYTFLKIIVDRELFLADENLNQTGEKLCVQKVSTLNISKDVFLNNDGIVIKNKINQKSFNNNFVSEKDIDISKNAILNGKNKTFEIGQAESIFEDLGIEITRGGTSNQKSDIVLDVSLNGKLFENQGFGIKSYLGSAPTLLNASGSNTNFIFEIKDFEYGRLEEINSINTRQKVKDRLNKILAIGCKLEFVKIEADTMQYNLQVLDDVLPNLVSKMLYNFYLDRNSILENNLKILYKNDEKLKSSGIDFKGYEIKVKRFLVAIMLGIFSGKKWNGNYSSNGSIIVKIDGSQVAFHITKLELLENFLFRNIKFDTPSTKRHRFAEVYKETNGKYYIKLNLQLRFLAHN